MDLITRQVNILSLYPRVSGSERCNTLKAKKDSGKAGMTQFKYLIAGLIILHNKSLVYSRRHHNQAGSEPVSGISQYLTGVRKSSSSWYLFASDLSKQSKTDRGRFFRLEWKVAKITWAFNARRNKHFLEELVLTTFRIHSGRMIFHNEYRFCMTIILRALSVWSEWNFLSKKD